MKKFVMEIEGYQTPLANTHLQWLMEYRLDRVVQLYKQNKLKDYLNEQVDKAEQQIELLMKAGRTRQMAEESVIYYLLAPSRENDPPEWPKKLLSFIPKIERSLSA